MIEKNKKCNSNSQNCKFILPGDIKEIEKKDKIEIKLIKKQLLEL